MDEKGTSTGRATFIETPAPPARVGAGREPVLAGPAATSIASLAPGKSATIVVVFQNLAACPLGNLKFYFKPQVLAGGFAQQPPNEVEAAVLPRNPTS